MKWLVSLALLAVLVAARNQTVEVKGVTTCGKFRLSKVVVELWDKDLTSRDDLMANATSNRDGIFALSGTLDEWTEIKPYLIFKHTCNLKNKKCIRHTQLPVPNEYINSQKAYQMPTVPLDIVGKDDKEVC